MSFFKRKTNEELRKEVTELEKRRDEKRERRNLQQRASAARDEITGFKYVKEKFRKMETKKRTSPVVSLSLFDGRPPKKRKKGGTSLWD